LLWQLGVVVLVPLALPAVAGAYRGDGVFTLAQGHLWGRDWRSGDAAMLMDGSVVGVVPSGAWRLTPDGRRTKIPGFGGSGVVATADGGVLALQGAEAVSDTCEEFDDCPVTVGSHRVVRWSSVTGASVVAGTGAQGFGGDGGPAVHALLDLGPAALNAFAPLPTGIVAEPDGSFVFADMANRRVRAVDGQGAIRTLAGNSPSTFRYPLGLAASPDGGYLVLEAGLYPGDDSAVEYLPSRLRRLRPDGTVETVMVRLGDAEDLVVAPDGSVVMATAGGELWSVDPARHTLRPYLRPRDPAKTFDFAARSIGGWYVGLDPSAGLLVAGDEVITYVPRGPTPWSLAALRSTRTSRRAVTAVIETTQAGTATIAVTRRQHVLARATVPVAAGHSTLRASGAIGKQWYRVRLRFQHAGAPTVHDNVPIYGAHTLPVGVARRLLGHYQGQAVDEDIKYWLGSDCRRFGPRRVDCAIAKTGDETSHHAGVASVTLEPTGIVLRRNYEWADRGFRRHPDYITGEPATVQRLSAGRGGRWAWGP
jgi:DNA-binding beta-propeller fold protein YncE